MLERVPEGAAATGAAAGASTTAITIVRGAIAVKTTTKIIVAAAALVALLAGTRLAGLWGGTTDAPRTGASEATAGPAARPGGPMLGTRVSAPGSDRSVHFEPDPIGALRLEGQVIDPDEQPVGGAVVALDSNPPRTTTTEADGSFGFDELLPRAYELEASAGRLYAGPVVTRLTAATEPVVLRATPGGTVHVRVVAAEDDAPVAGAEVALRSSLTWSAVTGDDGLAVIEGVGPGWRTVRVDAAGYAPATDLISSRGTPEAPTTVAIRLRRGAAIAGTVIDPGGAPVAGARVWATDAANPWPTVDPRLDAVSTGDDGRFRIPAVAAGTWRVHAADDHHAPGAAAPMRLDGEHPVEDVTITLAAGATIAGVVTGPDGQPLPAATVRVAGRGIDWSLVRESSSGADGRYRLSGLPRRGFDVVAAHDVGSSEVIPVDLASRLEARVDLPITIRGTLAGLVVDGGGQPIPEAQIVITPEWTGEVGERQSWRARGEAMLIADGGGAFRFTGLPPGSYRLQAARPGGDRAMIRLHPGVVARPGTETLRVVVQADGVITGRVLYQDGNPAGVFRIGLGKGWPRPFVTDDGRFRLEAPAGTYDLVVEGESFARTVVADVEVAEGETTDLASITVERGRSLSGRVVDSEGAPVEGATVATGLLISGGGTELNIPSEGHLVKEATTDADGDYLIAGLGEHPLMVVAGHEHRGRSPSVSVSRGPASVRVDLVLQPTGGLEGTVTRDGQPLPDTVVIANPRGATSSNFFVVTGPDGSYAFERLSAGSYFVSAMIGGGGPRPKDMHTRDLTIEAGRTSKVDIAIEPGPLTITVDARTDAGAPVLFGQVVAANLAFDAETLEAARDRFQPGDDTVFHIRTITFGKPVTIEGARPGTFTVCVVPAPVDPDDPASMRKAMEAIDNLPLQCETRELAAEPAGLDWTLTVPAEWLDPKN
jgi:protocatechuate 3,4-dioxygenase beta subunit